MVAGDPHKLVFAKGIGKLVAAIDQSTLTADADPRRPARRVIRPGIQLLDLENGSSSPTHKQVLLLGQAESRITSMLSWTPTDGERYLEIIVVGLYIEGRDTAHCDGRMVYLTPFQDGQKGNELNIGISRTIRFVGSPIYSLAPYASSSLVVCAGPHLFLQTLDLSTGKWTRGPHHPLPSPAVSLHVSGRFIYATTARHSLMVFEVDRGELSLRAEEAKQREAIRGATQFVGTAEGGMLSVSSNRGGRVLGLSKQDQGDFLLLFDASFPVTVNCLRKSHDRDTATQAGNRYYGTTQDGALYQFTVLGRKEWEFLNFLARVSWKRHTEQPRVKRKLSSQQRRQRKKFQATEMHINGDHLVELLHGGPQELRRLLEEPPCPNLEERESLSPDQKLRELSRLGEPLFGKSEDILLAASRWMRKLVSDT